MPVKQHTVCNDIIWIDVAQPTDQEMDSISRQYRLHKELVRDCMQPDHLPKYDMVDEVRFLIVRYYSPDSNNVMGSIQELSNKIALFYTEKFLITIHLNEIDYFETVREQYIEKGLCSGTAEAVTKIIWYTLESYYVPAQYLDDRVDIFEKNILLKRVSKDQIRDLYFIKRQAGLTAKILLLMTEPINHIYNNGDTNPELQDVKDHHLKMMTLYQHIFDEVNNLMNLHMSFATQKTNEVMKVLTLFSVFFMPLTFIVGIYGMNFSFMPELRYKWGYPIIMAVMATIALIIYFWFKRKKWLK
jgi:magnesium transporter